MPRIAKSPIIDAIGIQALNGSSNQDRPFSEFFLVASPHVGIGFDSEDKVQDLLETP